MLWYDLDSNIRPVDYPVPQTHTYIKRKIFSILFSLRLFTRDGDSNVRYTVWATEMWLRLTGLTCTPQPFYDISGPALKSTTHRSVFAQVKYEPNNLFFTFQVGKFISDQIKNMCQKVRLNGKNAMCSEILTKPNPRPVTRTTKFLSNMRTELNDIDVRFAW